MNYQFVMQEMQTLRRQIAADQGRFLDAAAIMEMRIRAIEKVLFNGGWPGFLMRLSWMLWPSRVRRMINMLHENSVRQYRKQAMEAELNQFKKPLKIVGG